MKTLKKYIITSLFGLILILVLTSCKTTENFVIRDPECIVPERVTLDTCNDEMSDFECSKTMLNNINLLVLYSQQLETTVKCYKGYFEILKKNNK